MCVARLLKKMADCMQPEPILPADPSLSCAETAEECMDSPTNDAESQEFARSPNMCNSSHEAMAHVESLHSKDQEPTRHIQNHVCEFFRLPQPRHKRRCRCGGCEIRLSLKEFATKGSDQKEFEFFDYSPRYLVPASVVIQDATFVVCNRIDAFLWKAGWSNMTNRMSVMYANFLGDIMPPIAALGVCLNLYRMFRFRLSLDYSHDPKGRPRVGADMLFADVGLWGMPSFMQGDRRLVMLRPLPVGYVSPQVDKGIELLCPHQEELEFIAAAPMVLNRIDYEILGITGARPRELYTSEDPHPDATCAKMKRLAAQAFEKCATVGEIHETKGVPEFIDVSFPVLNTPASPGRFGGFEIKYRLLCYQLQNLEKFLADNPLAPQRQHVLQEQRRLKHLLRATKNLECPTSVSGIVEQRMPNADHRNPHPHPLKILLQKRPKSAFGAGLVPHEIDIPIGHPNTMCHVQANYLRDVHLVAWVQCAFSAAFPGIRRQLWRHLMHHPTRMCDSMDVKSMSKEGAKDVGFVVPDLATLISVDVDGKERLAWAKSRMDWSLYLEDLINQMVEYYYPNLSQVGGPEYEEDILRWSTSAVDFSVGTTTVRPDLETLRPISNLI